MLKVNVRHLPPEGVVFDKKVTAEELELIGDDDPKFAGPISVSGKVEKAGDYFLATTHLQVKYADQCARCLEPVEEGYAEDYSFDYPFDKMTEFVDLADDIRQELILNTPAKALCKEDCKGICFKCGANLNLEKCKCK